VNRGTISCTTSNVCYIGFDPEPNIAVLCDREGGSIGTSTILVPGFLPVVIKA
jgi:hypothetical protein